MSWSKIKALIKSVISSKVIEKTPSSPYPNGETELTIAYNLMKSAITVMSKFPKDFFPSTDDMPQFSSIKSQQLLGGFRMEEILSNKEVKNWLNEIMAELPEDFMSVFINSGSIIGQILEGFGARDESQLDLMEMVLNDHDSLNLMMMIGRMREERGGEENLSEDPIGFEYAALNEISRRRLAGRIPFAHTLTTLLGQDALMWLTADSQEGIGKIQPHEFSRTGWQNIWTINTQLKIENELMNVPLDYMYLAKMMVALSWTLVCLASYVRPAMFLGESMPHIVSRRGGMFTVANGVGSHTLISFQPSSMPGLVKILAEGLLNPLLSAADLMWIGAGLARIQSIKASLGQAISVEEEEFGMFLSHRGRDAKLLLSENVQRLRQDHGVFLDCLTLPRGVINRSFVFGSLARSKQIIIVETENFNESEWCRKEAWLAGMMALQNLARVNRVALPDAITRIAENGDSTARRRSNQGRIYPIAPRVLRDIDYWARTPNIHSLKEGGYSTDYLTPLLTILKTTPRPDDSVWVRTIGETVLTTLTEAFDAAPEAEPIDIWSTALQLSLAAFATASNAYSKNDVRRGIDQLNAALNSIIALELQRSGVFKKQPSKHLALLAAAAAIDLSGINLHPRMLPAVNIALEGVAAVQDGLILFDVRKPGDTRNFRLRLIATLVQNNLGSLGIVQTSKDEVHNGRIDTFLLEVLPCVTLYPGMKDPF